MSIYLRAVKKYYTQYVSPNISETLRELKLLTMVLFAISIAATGIIIGAPIAIGYVFCLINPVVLNYPMMERTSIPFKRPLSSYYNAGLFGLMYIAINILMCMAIDSYNKKWPALTYIILSVNIVLPICNFDYMLNNMNYYIVNDSVLNSTILFFIPIFIMVIDFIVHNFAEQIDTINEIYRKELVIENEKKN